MSKFKNKLASFFYGRYGNDTLNKTLTAIYLVWLIAFSIVDIFDTSGTRVKTVNLSSARAYGAATTLGNFALFGGGSPEGNIVDIFV